MPAVFVSHGSPMTALDDGAYAKALRAFGKTLEPNAIVVISAHWQEPGIRIAAGKNPELIYDFGGFPPELYELRYDAPGAPELANKLRQSWMPLEWRPRSMKSAGGTTAYGSRCG